MPAGRAVIPGARQGHRSQDRVRSPCPGRRRIPPHGPGRTPPGGGGSRIGGQQLPEHAAAQPQHPRADHRLGSLQARATAAQRPRRFRSQPPYLGGFLPRDRLTEPPFSPSGAKRESVPAAGLASQIFSFTSAICPQIAANSPCRATSRRTFSTSPAANCGPRSAPPGRPGPQEPGPVAGMIRGRARAVRLPAPAISSRSPTRGGSHRPPASPAYSRSRSASSFREQRLGHRTVPDLVCR